VLHNWHSSLKLYLVTGATISLQSNWHVLLERCFGAQAVASLGFSSLLFLHFLQKKCI